MTEKMRSSCVAIGDHTGWARPQTRGVDDRPPGVGERSSVDSLDLRGDPRGPGCEQLCLCHSGRRSRGGVAVVSGGHSVMVGGESCDKHNSVRQSRHGLRGSPESTDSGAQIHAHILLLPSRKPRRKQGSPETDGRPFWSVSGAPRITRPHRSLECVIEDHAFERPMRSLQIPTYRDSELRRSIESRFISLCNPSRARPQCAGPGHQFQWNVTFDARKTTAGENDSTNALLTTQFRLQTTLSALFKITLVFSCNPSFLVIWISVFSRGVESQT